MISARTSETHHQIRKVTKMAEQNPKNLHIPILCLTNATKKTNKTNTKRRTYKLR